MSNWIYWMIITLLYIIGAGVIHARHCGIERFQLRMIESLKHTIRAMGGEVTEEEGQITIQYHKRGDDE